MLRELLLPELIEMVEARQWNELREVLEDWPAAEIADLIRTVEPRDRVLLFRSIEREVGGEVFAHLEADEQEQLLSALTDEQTRGLLAALEPDDRAALLSELPGEVTRRLLNLLSPADLREVRQLLGYPEDSIGRLMTPSYVALRAHWTVDQSMEHLRRFGPDKETLDTLFVVDQAWALQGTLGLVDLVLSPADSTVGALLEQRGTPGDAVVSLRATDDREEAVRAFQKYDQPVLPVVDERARLLGIVTHDDILDVAQAEATEDIQKGAAVVALDHSFTRASPWELYRKRVGWLLVLLVADFFSSSVIKAYQGLLDHFLTLAIFIPIILGTGGNTGTQSSTLVIRALATGDLEMRTAYRALVREVFVGLLMGVTLGLVIYGRSFFWTGGPHMGVVVGAAMTAVVVWAGLVGATLPLAFTRLGIDPAVVSAPFISTFVDATGLLIYFSIASAILAN